MYPLTTSPLYKMHASSVILVILIATHTTLANNAVNPITLLNKVPSLLDYSQRYSGIPTQNLIDETWIRCNEDQSMDVMKIKLPKKEIKKIIRKMKDNTEPNKVYQKKGQTNVPGKKYEITVGQITPVTGAANGLAPGREDVRRTVPSGGRLTSKAYPYHAVGVLQSKHLYQGHMIAEPCTGTIVGPKHVITACHCVTHEGKFDAISGMLFYPHFNQEVNDPIVPISDQVQGTAGLHVKSAYCLYGFLHAQASAKFKSYKDIALLEMKNPFVNSALPYLAIETDRKTRIQNWINSANQKIVKMSYPGDKANRYNPTYRNTGPFKKPFKMHKGYVFASGQINTGSGPQVATEIEKERITDYKYKTFNGGSGSSVLHWVPSRKIYACIAIQSTKNAKGDFEHARFPRITYLRGKQLNAIINNQQSKLQSVAIPAAAKYEYDNIYNEDLEVDNGLVQYDNIYDGGQSVLFTEDGIISHNYLDYNVMIVLLILICLCCMCGLVICFISALFSYWISMKRNTIKSKMKYHHYEDVNV
eukprot:463705_1